MLLETGQMTPYHVADDGDIQAGVPKRYVVQDAGQYAGTTNIDVAHYAAPTISFTAPNQVNDAAAGLATILTGDIVVIKGAANPANNGEFNVMAGGVAGAFTTVEGTIVNELAGAYISLYKRAAHSNNIVIDMETRLFWSRYTSTGEAVGVLSDGTLNWYDAATVFPLHPAAADLQMIAPDTLRIVGGAAEVARYHIGDLIDCAGFANAANNLPGYYVVSVTVNGADLDIVLDPINNVLVSEAAAGARTIGLVTRSIFNYSAGARLAVLSGHTRWRIPNDMSLTSLRDMEAPNALPDAVAFPAWNAGVHWSSTTSPAAVANATVVNFLSGVGGVFVKTNVYRVALARIVF
jgi:hypothetical protein